MFSRIGQKERKYLFQRKEILVTTREEYLATWMSWERYSNSRRVFKSLMKKKYCKSIGTSVVSG